MAAFIGPTLGIAVKSRGVKSAGEVTKATRDRDVREYLRHHPGATRQQALDATKKYRSQGKLFKTVESPTTQQLRQARSTHKALETKKETADLVAAIFEDKKRRWSGSSKGWNAKRAKKNITIDPDNGRKRTLADLRRIADVLINNPADSFFGNSYWGLVDILDDNDASALNYH